MKVNQTEKTFHIIGWGLFIVCALFFLVSSVINRDLFAFVGSIVFLIACLVFLVPLLGTDSDNETRNKD